MLQILSFIRGFLYSEFPLTEVPLYRLCMYMLSMTVHVADRVGEVQVDLLGGLCLFSLLAQHPLLAASLHGEVQGLHTHTDRGREAMVKVGTAVDLKRSYLLTGRCYEVEICAILLPLRCSF